MLIISRTDYAYATMAFSSMLATIPVLFLYIIKYIFMCMSMRELAVYCVHCTCVLFTSRQIFLHDVHVHIIYRKWAKYMHCVVYGMFLGRSETPMPIFTGQLFLQCYLYGIRIYERAKQTKLIQRREEEKNK